MAHMFTGIGKPRADASGEPSKPINVHAVLGKAVLIVVSLLIIGYALYNLVGFISHVSANWKEIQFAYEKPSIVKQVRTSYQSKETALDNQFNSGKPSEEAQVLNQLKAALSAPSK